MRLSTADRLRQKIAPTEEKRVAARLKSYVEAWADPGGVKPAIPCVVIDISTTGARIDCKAELPDQFILVFGQARHLAKVVWRRQTLFGVAFRKGVRRPRAGAAPKLVAEA
ncbi:PilZ domain-containing protein [Methylocystis echinoides]|uniref:PilZ domain-containing protein n=1 Tax=Methylocystis echinoides TaxID=29468 RepID=UPI00341655E5